MNHWLLTFFAAALTGVVAIFCGGLVAGACVSWYRISSFEGQSAYFVAGVALLSGILGGIIGGITAILMLKGPQGNFAVSMGWSCGIVVGIALLAAAAARLLADVAPRIDGDTLTLETELRLPPGVGLPDPESGYSYVKLFSFSGSKTRSHWPGDVHLQRARKEDGRWILPGEVEFYTTKGTRSLVYFLTDREPIGWILPLPRRPGPASLEWSEWLPTDAEPGEGGDLRFRLRKNTPPPVLSYEERTAAEVAARLAVVEALDLAAPMEEWLPYLHPGTGDPADERAIERWRERPRHREEIIARVAAEDSVAAATCLRLVALVEPDDSLVEAVTGAGADLARRIEAFNGTPPEEDPSFQAAADASLRFSGWMVAVRFLRDQGTGDFVPELSRILELSRKRPESIAMRQDICRVASFYLHEWAGIPPHPDDPPPR